MFMVQTRLRIVKVGAILTVILCCLIVLIISFIFVLKTIHVKPIGNGAFLQRAYTFAVNGQDSFFLCRPLSTNRKQIQFILFLTVKEMQRFHCPKKI